MFQAEQDQLQYLPQANFIIRNDGYKIPGKS